MVVTHQHQRDAVFLDGDHPSHILRLPTELVEHVACYLTDDADSLDLLQLRTTCRDMHAKTMRLVAEHYFWRGYFFTADEESLKVLLEISTHPIFARSMRKIRFCVREADPCLEPGRLTEHDAAGLEAMRPMLSQIKALGLGERRLYPYFNDGFNESSNYYALDVLIKAVVQTDYPATELALAYDFFGIPPDIFKHFRGSAALSNLKTLRLSLAPTTTKLQFPASARRRPYEAGVADLIKALRTAENLEVLELSSARFYREFFPNPLLGALASAAAIPDRHGKLVLRNIRELELGELRFAFDDLVRLVRSVRSTLTRIYVGLFFPSYPRHPDPGRPIRDAHGGENLTLEGAMFTPNLTDFDFDW